jgi:hypothetical protein
MLRMIVLVVAFALLTTVPSLAREAPSKKPKVRRETIVGEVVDTTCYITKGAHGPEHKECAAACIKGGAPIGIVAEDGTLVLVFAGAGDEGKAAYAAMKKLPAETVRAKGTVHRRNGVTALAVDAVEEVE